MPSRFVLGAILVAASIATPGMSQAATKSVTIWNAFFDPGALTASAGDTIVWTMGAAGAHNVVTYAGNQSFGSAVMYSAGESYSQTFSGGSVFYRCTLHSSINVGGACAGMCGSMSDRISMPTAPSISTPAPGSSVSENPVAFSGSAEPFVQIHLYDSGSLIATALSGTSGSWTASGVMNTGSRTVTARAVDGAGNTSPDTSVTFTVTQAADLTPPTITIGGTRIQAGLSGSISGTAADNIGVTQIVVYFYPLSGGAFPVMATCPCPAASLDWSVDAALPPGYYGVQAYAYDARGNYGASNPINLVVL